MDPSVIGAIITAVATIVAAIVTVYVRKSNRTEIERRAEVERQTRLRREEVIPVKIAADPPKEPAFMGDEYLTRLATDLQLHAAPGDQLKLEYREEEPDSKAKSSAAGKGVS